MVSAQPGVTIAPGGSTTFTVAFTPQAAGLRTAEIMIPSNSGSGFAFPFAIQGTGVATTNAGNGLQVGTVVAGSGAGAQNTQELSVIYTGMFLNGNIFDSTARDGGNPFQFPLGEGQVISGWDQGLVGMEVGETRVLFIPPSLGYGPGGNPPVIPGNTPLIFVVELVSIS